MNQPSQNPSDIAREALLRIAVNRVPPTPDNFRKFYEEIAGTSEEESFPKRELRSLWTALARKTAKQKQIAQRFERAIGDADWTNFRAQMKQLLQEAAETSPPWGILIHDLLAQLERPHAEISNEQKRKAIEQVLAVSPDDELQLFQQIRGVIRSWRTEPPADPAARIEAPPEIKATIKQEPEPQAPAEEIDPREFDMRPLVAHILEEAVAGLLVEAPELAESAKALAAELRQPEDEFDAKEFLSRLRSFSYSVEWNAQDQAGVRNGLVKLLRLVFENINDIVLGDSRMQGKIADALTITEGPLDRKAIDNLSQRLQDLILKQSALKKSLVETQERLKTLLTRFVEHLATLFDSTEDYRERIKRCAIQVANAASINDLSTVIEDLARETRSVQMYAEASRSNFSGLRDEVDSANEEIARLQNELTTTSLLVRHDPLTGALNRQGMDEMLAREIDLARRQNKSLCLTLIDVDDFKQIGERLGQKAGDDALVHLARALGDLVRPQDSIARYGSEEFVIILPDTDIDEAAMIIRRLQREATRRFFMHEKRKQLVTFSAGVCELATDETPEQALDRAAAAMQEARRSGKNRVEIALGPDMPEA